MRDYINRLSRGKFDFKENKIVPKDEIVRLNVESGLINSGSFNISAKETVSGWVYATDLRIKIENNKFSGKECEIKFKVDGRNLRNKEIVEGKFIIISDAGEVELPFVFKAIPRFITTSLGDASNLFHFTNLYQVARNEAIEIFFRSDFKSVFLSDEDYLCNVYDVIKNEKKGLEAIEEFLIISKKKMPITYKLESNKKTYAKPDKNIKDILCIKKNGWGYFNLNISCIGDFVRVSKDTLNSDDFTGDICELEYYIDAKKLHSGNNFAKIVIENFNTTLEYIIECKENDQILRTELETKVRDTKMAYKRLVMEYIDYRMQLVRKDVFVSHVRQILARCHEVCEDDLFLKLALAQSFLISGEYEEGQKILDEVKVRALASINSDPVNYCYFLYVNSLVVRSAEYTQKVIKQVRSFYESGVDSWQILWILFYLTVENENNRSIRLIRLKDIVAKGCTSPVMYFEALKIFNKHPELLRVLDDFELKVISFGIRHNAVSKNLSRQIASVLDEVKYASNEQITILKILYEIYHSDEILEPLVKHLVRLGQDNTENNYYFELGIIRGLKITRIYEYYISSCPRDLETKFPKTVLMYFMYDNNLSREDKSFLYANIVYNKNVYKDEYPGYFKIIEGFIIEQLKLGYVNEFMAVLYKNMLRSDLINDDNANFVSLLNYINMITVYDKRVLQIIVKITEKSEIDYYDVVDGKCFVPIYTDNCALLFLCSDGVIRQEGIDYSIKELMPDLVKHKDLMQYEIYNEGYLVNWADSCHKKGELDETVIGGYKGILINPNLDINYKLKINSWLIKYYYEQNLSVNVESTIRILIKDDLKFEDATRLLEIMINNGLYDLAYDFGIKYSFRGVIPAKLLRLCNYLLDRFNGKNNENLDFITKYLFVNREFNAKMLEYMIENFNGTNEDYYKLWKTCKNFNLDVVKLSERAIVSMMFARVHNGRMTEIFTDYYEHKGLNLISKAYISYNAFLYIVHGKKSNDIVYKVLEDGIKKHEGVADICYLAYLKEISKRPEILQSEGKRQISQKMLDYLCNKNIMSDFYNLLTEYLILPFNMVGCTVVECIANPDCKVMIHYILNEESNNYTSDVMQSTDFGLFTYKFNLFYGDSLRYYFTIEGGGNVTRTNENIVDSSCINVESKKGRFDHINDCYAGKELRDYMTLRRVMESYCVEDYVVESTFTMRKD